MINLPNFALIIHKSFQNVEKSLLTTKHPPVFSVIHWEGCEYCYTNRFAMAIATTRKNVIFGATFAALSNSLLQRSPWQHDI